MKFGLIVYRMATVTAAPLLILWFRHRARHGKETRQRLNERHARALPLRPQGDLIWLHGASIGESKLLLAIIAALHARRPELNFLMTSQTASAAKIVADNLPPKTRHQMAPIDTPATSKRFISHWRPNLFILAESEVWPNLLSATQSSGAATALINARMTESSLKRWRKFSRSAAQLFSHLNLINATDEATANLLSDFAGRKIPATSNLKIGAMLTPLTARHASQELASETVTEDKVDTVRGGKILLGASTHQGEEQLLIDAFKAMPKGTKLILAPRHIDRADEISRRLDADAITHAHCSIGGTPSGAESVLIADTFGEMDRWYACADIVYLGGAHVAGIGGHNPLEPLRFGKPVLSGPHTSNFSDVYADLTEMKLITTVTSSAEIVESCGLNSGVDMPVLESFMESGKQQFDETINALLALIERPTE